MRSEESKAKQREYTKEWKRKHPGKAREYNRAWRKKYPERARASTKRSKEAWRAKTPPEVIAQLDAKWHEKYRAGWEDRPQRMQRWVVKDEEAIMADDRPSDHELADQLGRSEAAISARRQLIRRRQAWSS